ncbi:restriction endonuclease subunit S [Exiguobacterium acetylicum]|uniref:Restriction endonuclease subunit S n=1 Tax=Exiguobacterium acetylicum TaxID=41170 RepID=A0ABX8GE56_EXIAC|nr:restriction endonuclease subunit S [Exiguobacterium acetylicum]QWB31940.1 restriction endonuclease subunit S [Exiguobacterium acetylicum]
MNAYQLKNSILQYAIEGKLVNQDVLDKPASELLKQISEQKEQMIKEKTIKKEKSLPPINEEEIPFNIPDTWEWVRLGDIGPWRAGSTPSRSNTLYYSGKIPWIKTGELNDGYVDESNEFISDLALKECSLPLNKPGSVLIAMYGATIGKVGILNIPATTNQACCATYPFEGVYNKYLFYYLFSMRNHFRSSAAGGAQPNISKEKLIKTLIPLPPTREQIKIVDKIEELFLKIDSYDNHYLALETLNKRFPKDLEKSILQYAIQGKLVKQDNKDVPASELLKRISEQKEQMIKEKIIKKEKLLPPITEEEIPFDIPDAWEWVRLQDVALITMGQSPEGTSVSEGIDGIEFHQGKSLFSKMYLTKSNQNTSNPKKIANAHSIIMSVRAPVGDVNILKDRSICIGRGLASIEPLAGIDLYYLNYYLQWAKPILESRSTGSTFKAVNLSVISRLTVPLPPTNEQIKIVKEIQNISNSIRNLNLLNDR